MAVRGLRPHGRRNRRRRTRMTASLHRTSPVRKSPGRTRPRRRRSRVRAAGTACGQHHRGRPRSEQPSRRESYGGILRKAASQTASDQSVVTSDSSRRSASLSPPHTPNRSGVRSACSKHSWRTGQVEQIRFAAASRPSRRGPDSPEVGAKNSDDSGPRHAARKSQDARLAVTIMKTSRPQLTRRRERNQSPVQIQLPLWDVRTARRGTDRRI